MIAGVGADGNAGVLYALHCGGGTGDRLQFSLEGCGAVALEPLDPIVGQFSSEALLCSLDDLAEQQP